MTDFDQRSALRIYPHVRGSETMIADVSDAFHRLGIGVDTLNAKKMKDIERLGKYEIVVLPATTVSSDGEIASALSTYVSQGGTLLISPLCGYQTWSGIFRGDGLGADLSELSGVTVSSLEVLRSESMPRKNLRVAWTWPETSTSSELGLNGLMEFLQVGDGVEIVARVSSPENVLNDKPVLTRRRYGEGQVIKLAVWPDHAAMTRLLQALTSPSDMFQQPAPENVLVVPRADQSFFVVNTSRMDRTISLKKKVKDRISERVLEGPIRLPGYEVLWLAR